MPANLRYSLYGIVGLLIVATLIIALKHLVKPNKEDHELGLRIRSWWVMAGIFILVIAISRELTILFFVLISALALKEYFNIIPKRDADRPVWLLAYLAIPLQYLWVWLGWYGLFITFIPVYMFLLLQLGMILKGETRGFLNAIGTLHWGLMITVFSLSHAAYLLALPDAGNPVANSAALLLFLVFLTEFNDVMQYVWGKLLGGVKIATKISPNKTLSGLLGGVTTTTILAWLLAPYLTPFTTWQSVAIGALIGIGGFIGDVTISALKRDIGIKDTGNLIPGHGGILDRVDSLTLTAPLFFHFVYYLYY